MQAAGSPRVRREFLGIHAVADDLGIDAVIGQVADPARHEIEDTTANRQNCTIEIGQCRRCALINMGDKPWRGVKCQVVTPILFGECTLGQFRECVLCGHARAPLFDHLRVATRHGAVNVPWCCAIATDFAAAIHRLAFAACAGDEQ